MTRLYRCTALIILIWLIGSCGGADRFVGPPTPQVGAVTVSQDTATLVPAASLQLSAAARSASGEVLQSTFSWTTSDPGKATVSSSGMVIGVAPGIASITAMADGKSATATITVLEGGVVSSTGATLTAQSGAVQILVPADALSSNTNLSLAASSTFAADPDIVPGSAFDFGPSGTSFAKPVVLRIRYNPANLPAGTEEAALELYLNSSSGWEVVPQSVVDLTGKTVSAPIAHFSTYAIRRPAAVAGIAISGAAPLTVGQSEQLTATVTGFNGRVLTNRRVDWTSSDPAVASIDQTGLVMGLKAGGVTISASAGGRTSSVVITVSPPSPAAVAAVTLSAATTPMLVGATQVLTATPKDASGATLSGRTVTWVSSNPAVLTTSAASSVSTSSGATVTVTAVGVGTATITATSEAAPPATTPVITVNQAPPLPVSTVTVTPTSASLQVGATQQLVATLKDASGNVLTGRTITWASESPAVASVNATGLVTAAMVGGPIEIIATSEGKVGASVITVTNAPPPTVATVALSTPTTPMTVGETQALTATPRDAAGATLTGRTVNWVSSNTAVLTVSAVSSVSTSSGATVTVTAAGPGTATIMATSETAPSATTPVITVNPVPPPPVNTVTVTPTPVSMAVGSTQQLTATLRDASNNILTGRTITWSSNNAAATVDASGLVTAVSVGGPVTITATSEGKSGTSSIAVSAVPVASVTLSAATTPMLVGETQQLTAVTRDAAGNLLSGRLVTWVSSNTGVLTVSASGLVTAAGTGTATITATSEAAPGATTPVITVNPVPVATVTVTPPSASIIVGATQQLAAETRDAGGNVLTGRTVTWVSGTPAVATVDANGLVTAVSVGGPVTITATSEGQAGTSAITVNPVPVATVTLSTATTPMVVGATQQLTAVTRDANGNVLTGRTITWVSSNTAVLTVSATGLVTAAGQGTATITATSESVSAATPPITVNPAPPPPVNTVTLSPASASIQLGGTQQLTATLRDANNNIVTGRTITWSSNNTAVATVNGNGLVTAVSAGGPMTITATSEGKSGTSSITVTGSTLTLRASPFITSGLAGPVFLTQPLNDGRIFVVEQGGRIRVVLNGVLQTTPFLDISGRVINGGERGLLSVAFHPQYATNHFFYVYFIGSPSGEIRIERFTATSDPSVADPTSSNLIFTTPHPNGNHNGGLVTFGPDGMLYAAFGDGGGGSPDQDGNGQNFNAYLAGMIRIDVNNGDPYSVPADNPFVGQANRKPELWAKGFRNPWRYAFDPPSGLLFIADVGEALHEEVDAVAATRGGLNYGWSIMEGVSCFNATTCNQTGLQLPVLDYGHTGGACSITGGYVYRGSAMPAIQGHYFYSDFCAGWVHSLRYQNGSAVDLRDWGITLSQVKSFGQDAAGELYIVSASSIYKLVPGP